MASKVEIANRALQQLGAKRITSLSEDSRNARAISAAYEPVKVAELRKHPWSFAVKRVQLAASASNPIFERASQYPLPSDFLRLLPLDPEAVQNDEDWQIEGGSIITDDTGSLNVRYIANIDDPNTMDPMFREALSARLAYELAEEITQSNTKKREAIRNYEDQIAHAKRVNAIERVALVPPEDTWVSKRV